MIAGSSFGLALALAAWLKTGHRAPALAACATAALLLIALLFPRLAAPLARVVDFLIQRALRGLSWLLLALVFTLVFIPARLFRGLRRRAPLAAARPCWTPLPPDNSPSRYTRQF